MNKEFKKDFNSESSLISNQKLLNKYGFNSVREMCDYARENNLIVIKKLTEKEKADLKNIKKCLNEAEELMK